jgi:hypothetical protein
MSLPATPNLKITPGMIREAMTAHGSFTFRAFGGSMMPVVGHGALIRIEPLAPAEARQGDILFFAASDGRYIGHRFLGWRDGAGERLMLTSGDTLPHIDPPHPADTLLGRITATVRGGREVQLKRGAGSRVMGLANRWSCRIASPLLAFASLFPPGVHQFGRRMIRYLICGPVFVLGILVRR